VAGVTLDLPSLLCSWQINLVRSLLWLRQPSLMTRLLERLDGKVTLARTGNLGGYHL
jgi:hypothetical protein